MKYSIRDVQDFTNGSYNDLMNHFSKEIYGLKVEYDKELQVLSDKFKDLKKKNNRRSSLANYENVETQTESEEMQLIREMKNTFGLSIRELEAKMMKKEDLNEKVSKEMKNLGKDIISVNEWSDEQNDKMDKLR